MAVTSHAVTAQVHSSTVRFVRSSAASLKALNSLSESEIIVLFTPAIPLVNNIKPEGDDLDPFECLGRAISKRHARVRHVPFVSKVGLTDLHLAWIRRASAIIVVNCQPTLLSDEKSNDNMAAQMRFGVHVLDTLQDLPNNDHISTSCVYMGSTAAPLNTQHDNIISCSSYSIANMEKAAALLMG